MHKQRTSIYKYNFVPGKYKSIKSMFKEYHFTSIFC